MERGLRRGVSLVEVLVAAGLLAASVLVVASLSQRGLADAGAARDELVARQLLMDLCERYRDAELAELEAVARDPGAIERDVLLQPLARMDVPRDLRRAIALERDCAGVAGLHRLALEVCWTGWRGEPRRIVLERVLHAH